MLVRLMFVESCTSGICMFHDKYAKKGLICFLSSFRTIDDRGYNTSRCGFGSSEQYFSIKKCLRVSIQPCRFAGW